jgi:hypothetical protein
MCRVLAFPDPSVLLPNGSRASCTRHANTRSWSRGSARTVVARSAGSAYPKCCSMPSRPVTVHSSCRLRVATERQGSGGGCRSGPHRGSDALGLSRRDRRAFAIRVQRAASPRLTASSLECGASAQRLARGRPSDVASPVPRARR